jgi:hypothetical protein
MNPKLCRLALNKFDSAQKNNNLTAHCITSLTPSCMAPTSFGPNLASAPEILGDLAPTYATLASYVLLPLFQNIRCFSFVKQMYLDIF